MEEKIYINTKFSKLGIFPCTKQSTLCGLLLGKRKENIMQMPGIHWGERGFFWGKAMRSGVWMSNEHEFHIAIKDSKGDELSFKYILICLFKIRIRLKISRL